MFAGLVSKLNSSLIAFSFDAGNADVRGAGFKVIAVVVCLRNTSAGNADVRGAGFKEMKAVATAAARAPETLMFAGLVSKYVVNRYA